MDILILHRRSIFLATLFIVGCIVVIEKHQSDKAQRIPTPRTNDLQAVQKAKQIKLSTFSARKDILQNSKAIATSKIIINYKGRLGNRMFEYASLYGISRRLGLIPIVKEDDTVQKVFGKLRATVVNGNFSTKGFQKHFLRPACGFDSSVYNLDTSKDIELLGYACAWPYFHPHLEEDIRQQFTPREHIHQKVLKLLGKVRQGRHNAVIVGIHVRRGDYLWKERKHHGYVVAPRQYFIRAMEYFRNKYLNVVFVVCSNGIEWCKNNIKGTKDNPVYFSENNSAEVDMAILGNCNHTIISVGSFGWWGAYLSKGEVIYYKHQINMASSIIRSYVMRDFILPKWIAME